MTKDLTDLGQRRPGPQHLRRAGVAQHMRGHASPDPSTHGKPGNLNTRERARMKDIVGKAIRG